MKKYNLDGLLGGKVAGAEKFKENAWKEHTPLMRQYLQFKDQVGEDTLLFFRVGDFYELFWEDSVRIGQLLDLTVTKKGQSGGKDVVMSGVPWHALDLHLGRLIKMGVSAAVVDQIGDPATSKGPVERALMRIVTPGTLLDETLLSEKSDAPLLCVYPCDQHLYVSWMSVAAGKAWHEKITVKQWPQTLARIAPAEIVIPEHFTLDMGADKKRCVFQVPSWYFDPQRGFELWCQALEASTLMAYGLDAKKQSDHGSLASLCALMEHVKKALGGRSPHVYTLVPFHHDSVLKLEAQSRACLELLEPQHQKEGVTLASVLDRCATSMGSRLLRQWIVHPLTLEGEIQARYEAVEALMKSQAAGQWMVEAQNFPDIERAASRFAALQSRPRDFSALKNALEKLPAIKDSMMHKIKGHETPWLQECLDQLVSPPELGEWLNKVIDPNPSVFIRDGGVVADGYNQELDELRQLSHDAQQKMMEFEVKEKQATGITTLKIDFNRVQGFSIEIPKSQESKVPAHYQRKATLKNAERYTTMELQAFQAQVLSAKEQALALEKKIFEEMQKHMMGYAKALSKLSVVIASLDVLSSFAITARDEKYCKPQIKKVDNENKGSSIKAVKMRHPVVEKMIQTPFVANDLDLNENKTMALMTGPNMGGKSTYMRSAALALIMAQMGCFVAAESFTYTPMTALYTRIGAHDDIQQGHSTFMVEMLEANAILQQADARSLCLMDEIGRGTSTFDGLSLAWGILSHLHDKNQSLCLFASHYFELTHLIEQRKHCKNVHVSATLSDRKELVFLHQIQEGPASKSYGLEVAKLAGIPSWALECAQELLEVCEEHAWKEGPWIPVKINENEENGVGGWRGSEYFKNTPNESVNDPTKEKKKNVDQEAKGLEIKGDQESQDWIKEWKSLNVDDLTPKQALDWLYRMKEKWSS